MLKYLLLSILWFICFGTTNTFAKIWRVNNNPNTDANFTTLQAAHDGAAAGDTIQLESSGTDYGSLICTKKLIIIGTGYFLDENPDTQALKLSSKVRSIHVRTGAEGTVIMGLDFQTGYDVTLFCSNITIRRNKFSQSLNSNNIDYYAGVININYNYDNSNQPLSNIIISQNYGCFIQNQSYAVTGLLITNNYLTTYGYVDPNNASYYAVHLNPNTVALIQNNIFRGRVDAYNSSMFNNIQIAGDFTGTGNLVANNIGYSTQFGTSNGNKQNVDMSTVFIGPGEGISTDGKWKLKVGSPAIGAGFGSTQQNPIDAGMFGGSNPYVLSGLPPVPAIYYFENQPIGSSSDPIDVTIKVKSVN